MRGIICYGTYVPRFRLSRDVVASALGIAGGRGTRAVASYDEDSTTLGVEAARIAIGSVDGRVIDSLQIMQFTTSTPAYLDKTNATAIHAALDLPPRVLAYDAGGALRSGIGSLMASLNSGSRTLIISSDLRGGRPGSDEERNGGDAASAFMVGEGDQVIAQYLGGASATAEFLDRWRLPGETSPRVWEERFGEVVYGPLVEGALAAALKEAGVAMSELDHVIVTGTHVRAVRAAQRLFNGALVDDLTTTVGQTGTAHAMLILAAALDTAEAGERIAVVSLADGVDVLVFQATHAITNYRPALSVAEQIGGNNTNLDYATFLTWRGFLDRQPPRRPAPARPAAPPSFRSRDWKFGFIGSEDESSGAVHLPPQRVSFRGGARDEMVAIRRADVLGTVATFTIDHLAFSMSPPTIIAVVDFDGGGRYTAEVADATPGDIAIGSRIAMTFRRLYTAEGIHNYFWKARPIGAGEGRQ